MLKTNQLLIATTIVVMTLIVGCGGGSSSENSAPAPAAYIPDITWKTKTLYFNGQNITYELGKGNPKEVALIPSFFTKESSITTNFEYVTPQLEVKLQNFLLDVDLSKLLNTCLKNNEQNTVSFIDQNKFAMEYLLVINPNTGRKEILLQDLYSLIQNLKEKSSPQSSFLSAPLYSKCFPNDQENAAYLILHIQALLDEISSEYELNFSGGL